MYPGQPINTSPPPLQPHSIQRSWSDGPVDNYSRGPIRPAPRSSSFSASRAPQPQWNNRPPPPPPVPPLPLALRPSFYSPPLAHTNIDFTFAEPARGPPPLRRPGSSPNVLSSFHTSLPPLPRAPTHPFTQISQRDYFDSNSFALPRPVVPPRPLTSDVTDSPIVANFEGRLGRPYSYGDFKTLDRPHSPLPPVPPRPPITHGEVRFKSSPTMSSQAPSSAPPVPPKPVTSPVLLPSGEHTLTPSGKDNAIVEILATGSPFPEAQTSETLSLDSDIQQALTLSLGDSHRNHSADQTLEEKEDDELARALAESLSFAASLEQNTGQSQTDDSHCLKLPQLPVKPENLRQHARDLSGLTSSRRASVPDSGRDILSSEELEDHAAHGQILQVLDDEEVTRRLQEEEEQRLKAELRERERRDEERARMDAALIKRLQEEEATRSEAAKRSRERRDEERARMDAELARREEAEEKAQKTIREALERMDAAMARRMAETNNDGRKRATKGVSLAPDPAFAPGAPPLPLYNDIVSCISTVGPPTRPTPRTMQSLPQFYNESVQQTRPGRAASAFVSGSVRIPEPVGRGRSAIATDHPAGRGSDMNAEGVSPRSRDPSPGDNNSLSHNETPSRPRSLAGIAPQDDAIEPDLMQGVSYGFQPPDTLSPPAKPLSLCPSFPDVISLTRAPFPPFHIMATSWRHLMRLLAQLETRIQADLQAIAGAKDDHLLRVVVQFVKLPYSANTWRTILHLTIDQPVPPTVQNAWRYTNKDTALLPYSYTLSEPTPYLANNADSQFYVIPLSPTSPFPILPISLPNLALYLQSAMRDSRARKVQNDPSNGMRRLAKVVMDCYPEEVVNPDKEERKPSRGVGNLFKRVVGRGGGRDDSESQGNEDVYDIITPFRIDQYTTS